MQEAFCRLAQQSKMPDRIAPWLFRVSSNLICEEKRRDKRRLRRETKVAAPEVQPCVANCRMESQELLGAIYKLDKDLRDIVISKLWADLTFQEISDITGTPVTTLHRKYQTAIADLRSRVEGTNHEKE